MVRQLKLWNAWQKIVLVDGRLWVKSKLNAPGQPPLEWRDAVVMVVGTGDHHVVERAANSFKCMADCSGDVASIVFAWVARRSL